jgi:hypothetical protein
MALTDYSWEKLERRGQIRSFECTDRDLNDFLFDDALDYHSQLMGVTYLWVDETKNTVVAYYTLSNDKITKDEDERPIWNRISRPLPNRKRRKDYPAVKVGRLAVNSHYFEAGSLYPFCRSERPGQNGYPMARCRPMPSRKRGML